MTRISVLSMKNECLYNQACLTSVALSFNIPERLNVLFYVHAVSLEKYKVKYLQLYAAQHFFYIEIVGKKWILLQDFHFLVSYNYLCELYLIFTKM